MKILIVDDEELARKRLKRLLRQLGFERDLTEASDGEDALQILEAEEFDLVFLDIQMPGLDGLSLAHVTQDLPPVIFTTAYSQYAVEAFEVNAVDYLMKPIQQARLQASIERVQQRLQPKSSLQHTEASHATNPRILVKENKCVHYFDAREISRFWSADKYTSFLFNGKEYLLEESISSLEARLHPFGFLRVHRAELVQLSQVKTLINQDNQFSVILQDGQQARVSRRTLPTLKEELSK